MKLENYNNDLGSIMKLQTYSRTVTFNANTWTDVRFDINKPSGYVFLAYLLITIMDIMEVIL